MRFTFLILITLLTFNANASEHIDPAYGIDISKFQGDVIEFVNNNDGLTFLICKATEGDTFVDADFFNNWRVARDKKLIRGAYHFYRSDDEPIAQADNFLSTVNSWRLLWNRGFEASDLPAIVDVEDEGMAKNVDVKKFQQDLLQFLQYVEKQTGKRPIMYTDVSFADKYLLNPEFEKYPLWLAQYSREATPILPKAWKKAGYKFWQKSDQLNIDSKQVDFDLYNGKRQQLQSGLI